MRVGARSGARAKMHAHERGEFLLARLRDLRHGQPPRPHRAVRRHAHRPGPASRSATLSRCSAARRATPCPIPQACLITGITPQQAQREGLREAEFAARVHEELAHPGTCGVGYNSLRFDDEFTRQMLYRNFYDPYAREWRNGNSRWDLIDLARMCYALRPEGIEWPLREDGAPSFRLEDLAAANGIEQRRAHDALSDVEALIALARLIRARQPRLWDWYLGLRRKQRAFELLDLVHKPALLHVSSRYPARTAACRWSCRWPSIRARNNEIIVYDLAANPVDLILLDADDIADRVFTPRADLPEDVERIPLRTIHANRSPALAPLSVLQGRRHRRASTSTRNAPPCTAPSCWPPPDIAEKVRRVYAAAADLPPPEIRNWRSTPASCPMPTAAGLTACASRRPRSWPATSASATRATANCCSATARATGRTPSMPANARAGMTSAASASGRPPPEHAVAGRLLRHAGAPAQRSDAGDGRFALLDQLEQWGRDLAAELDLRIARMNRTYFTEDTFRFLRQLQRNNDREWFHAHKDQYEKHLREPFLALIADLQRADRGHQSALPRRPAQAGRLDCSASIATCASPTTSCPTRPGLARASSTNAAARSTRPSFYLHIEPGNCFAGGGIWHPESSTLRRIRNFIVDNPEAWKQRHRQCRVPCAISAFAASA